MQRCLLLLLFVKYPSKFFTVFIEKSNKLSLILALIIDVIYSKSFIVLNNLIIG